MIPTNRVLVRVGPRGFELTRENLRVIGNGLRCRVPVEFFAGPVGLRGHDAGYGMREAVVNGAVRLLAGAQAFEPVGHVFGGKIIDAHGRKLGLAGQQNIF